MDTATTTITGPAGIVQLVPEQCGYVPQDSLVMLLINRGRLVVTARTDLAPMQADPLRNTYRLLKDTIDQANRRGHDVDGVLWVVYTSTLDRLEPLATCLQHMDAGPRVVDVLAVTATRYRSWMCENTACCPAEGVRLP